MYAVSLRVPSKLIRDFSIFSVIKAIGSSSSARCSTVANSIYQFMDVLFRWMIYCVMPFSLISWFHIFLLLILYLLSLCSVTVESAR
jgi:hypothetical protein